MSQISQPQQSELGHPCDQQRRYLSSLFYPECCLLWLECIFGGMFRAFDESLVDHFLGQTCPNLSGTLSLTMLLTCPLNAATEEATPLHYLSPNVSSNSSAMASFHYCCYYSSWFYFIYYFFSRTFPNYYFWIKILIQSDELLNYNKASTISYKYMTKNNIISNLIQFIILFKIS